MAKHLENVDIPQNICKTPHTQATSDHHTQATIALHQSLAAMPDGAVKLPIRPPDLPPMMQHHPATTGQQRSSTNGEALSRPGRRIIAAERRRGVAGNAGLYGRARRSTVQCVIVWQSMTDYARI